MNLRKKLLLLLPLFFWLKFRMSSNLKKKKSQKLILKIMILWIFFRYDLLGCNFAFPNVIPPATAQFFFGHQAPQ